MFHEDHRFEHLTILKLGECHLLDDASIQSIIKTYVLLFLAVPRRRSLSLFPTDALA